MLQARRSRPARRRLIGGEPLPLDEFKPEVVERLVIKVELALEHAVGHTAPPLQHGNRLVDDFFKRHDGPLHVLSRLASIPDLIIPRTQGGCVSKEANFCKQIEFTWSLF